MTIQTAAAETAVTTDRTKFLWLIALGWLALPAVAACLALATVNGLFFWLVPIFWFGLVPFLDVLLPPNGADQRQGDSGLLDSDAYFERLISLAVPVVYVTLIYCTWVVSVSAPRWYSLVGIGLSLGVSCGILLMVSRAYAQRASRTEELLSFLATAIIGCGHFRLAHTVAHQQACATQDDPLSSRMGEDLYSFLCRSLPRSIVQAWRLEQRRADPGGSAQALWRNEIVQSLAFTLCLFTMLVLWAGVRMIPVLVTMVLFAWFFQMAVVYIQHYGLLRGKRADGAYARCCAAHSWNSTCAASGLLLFNATRHADAHVHPSRPFQSMRVADIAPRLPFAYPLAIIAAALPPVWFRTMDPLVARWAKGDLLKVNIDGGAYSDLMARYHRPDG